MDTYYTMASKYFMTTGKDGFSAFLDKSVIKVTEKDQSPTIQEIMKNFFKSFAKSDAEIEAMSQKARTIFEQRLTMLGASRDVRSDDGYIKIAPTLQRRIVNVGDPVKHED